MANPESRLLFTGETEQDPEYWDGHGREDKCLPSGRPDLALLNLAASSSASEYGRQVLGDFLNSPRALARLSEKGEAVRAAALREGSVLRFRYESLVTSDILPEGNYTVGDYWGVVCDTGKMRIKAIYVYKTGQNGGIYVGNPNPETVINSDRATHRITKMNTHKFERYSNITSFTTGRGKKIGINIRMPRLDFGFVKPLVNPT